jgi:hypothetical protein
VELHNKLTRVSDYSAEDESALGQSVKVLSDRPDRFLVRWSPDSNLRGILRALVPLYALALLVALVMAAGPIEALNEWVRLLHLYSGMITLGGGIFQSLVFKLSTRSPTPTERAAVTDVARTIYGSWRIAALMQLITGFILVWLYRLNFEPWLVQSIILYLAALYLWWIGFDLVLRAAKHDALYKGGSHITEFHQMGTQRLLLATLLTAWVLVTMIYKHDADMNLLLNKLLSAFG